MAICIDCYDEYSDKRKMLGYSTCLPCGAKFAKKETVRKSKRIAPLYSKGAYQYITDKTDLTVLGRKI